MWRQWLRCCKKIRSMWRQWLQEDKEQVAPVASVLQEQQEWCVVEKHELSNQL